jgi:hypothetical protein
MDSENSHIPRPQHQIPPSQDPSSNESPNICALEPKVWEGDNNIQPHQDPQSVYTIEQSINETEVGVSRKPPRLEGREDIDQPQNTYERRTTSIVSSSGDQPAAIQPISPLQSPDFIRPIASPPFAIHSYRSPSSPRQIIHSSSPRMHSPASSQIFERSVQEDILPTQASPSIPSHIMTDNHIPPILEASSAAITDDHLDPDSVEIVTHSIHQPALVTVTGGSAVDQSAACSWHEEFSGHSVEDEDPVSNYGASDSADVRRLSFISFADVVHAEHVENGEQFSSRDSFHNLALSNNQSAPTVRNRSPSPIRSPVSSQRLSTSPPTSISPSSKGLEASPSRGRHRPGSPLSLPSHNPSSGNFHGELNIETMRQALRRTGSGDMSGIRNVQLSAVGDENIDRAIK